jgi:5-methylcytosine-specific restriction protein B
VTTQPASFSDVLAAVMDLQSSYSPDNTDKMKERSLLVRDQAPARLRSYIASHDATAPYPSLLVEGKDGTGLKTRVAWIRVYSRKESPKATIGWYLAYLFAADGKTVFLSLNQGTTEYRDGSPHARPPAEIAARSHGARELLKNDIHRIEGLASIALKDSPDAPGKGYENGNVTALRYERTNLPDDAALFEDLDAMLGLLSTLYAQQPSNRWDEFVGWAKKFREEDDFDAEERDYKIEVAANLSTARQAFLSGEDWLEKLRNAFGPPNNLTPWREHSRFLNLVHDDPEAGTELLGHIWLTPGSYGDPLSPNSTAHRAVAGFVARLEDTSGTHGIGMPEVLASFMAGAIDPYDLPIYRASPYNEAYKLTGEPPWPPAAPKVERYFHALRFLDKFTNESAQRGLQLRDRLDAQSLVWSVTRSKPPQSWGAAVAAALESYRNGVQASGRGSVDPTDLTITQLADELLVDHRELERIMKLWESKKQIVLYGPPGTGKTYIAQALARFAAGTEDNVTIVQFHPSYAYEDFVEGYRPSLVDGQPSFQLRPGPLKQVAEAAANDPSGTYVILIDELNRGNLAKVMGELYFLLEYRKRKIRLQYSESAEDLFALPDNVWFICTMNTVDRSIALVDAALRRRFYFIRFFPDQPPIQGMLARWLAKHRPEFEWVATLVDHANSKLGNRHGQIGPSYFMKEDLDDEWLDLIWDSGVMPYLEEQMFGMERDLEGFGLARLKRELAGELGNGVALEQAEAGGDGDSAS